jgi:hypothetical protein
MDATGQHTKHYKEKAVMVFPLPYLINKINNFKPIEP